MNNNKFISVITTSFNSAQYIENTLRSVIDQGYPGLQYIVVDAASTDGTVEILNKYSNSIDVLISEPDKGMYHGIEKGAGYVQGEIMAWLNSDDAYLPWTFSVVNEIFNKYPDIDWIIGQPSYMNRKGQCIKVSSNAGTSYPSKYISNGWFRPQFAGHLQQESMFWRKSLWDKVGGLNLDLKLAADFELWTRFAQYAELYSVTTPLACFRLTPGEQKSSVSAGEYDNEVQNICGNFARPNKIWDFVSTRGEVLRVLSRLLIWKRANIISYSSKSNDWVINSMCRPLSRYSITEALLESRSYKK